MAAMFAHDVDSANPARVARACDGVFTAIRVDSSGTGAALTDVLGLRHLYVGENDHFLAVSTQAEAVAQVLAEFAQPEKDLVGVAGLAFSGFLIGNRTGFAGVRRLDPGEAVTWDPTRRIRPARFETYDPAPWSSGGDLDSLSRSDLVSLFAAELKEGVRVAADAPVEHRRADITGGRDSRLILAAVLQGGLQDRFRFRTLGADDLGDVEIGTSIARAFDLDHRAGTGFDPAPREQLTASFEARARRFVAATGGTVNLWDDELVRTPLPQIHLCGLGGEVLRTYWPKKYSLASVDELILMFGRHYGTSGLLRREYLHYYENELRAELLHDPTGEATLFDLLDLHYVRHRLRSRCGPLEDVGPRLRYSPLISKLGLQVAFALGPHERRRETLHRATIDRLAPELADFPLLGGWPDDTTKFEQGAVGPANKSGAGPGIRSRVAALTPRRNQRILPDTVNTREQTRRFAERRSFFAAVIDNTENPLWEAVDRQRATELLADFEQLRWAERYELYGAITAAIWLE